MEFNSGFKGLKKESTATTKETWKIVNITQSRLYKHWPLPTLQSWKSHREECECLYCRKWGHFYRLLWLRIVCHILGILAQDTQYTYTVCPLDNETAFITRKKLIYLEVLIADFRCNCHPTWHNAETVHTGPRNRAGTPAVPFSSLATPRWMSLMSLLGPVSPSVREEKSAGAKSGEWWGGGGGGCWITWIDLEARNYFTFNVQLAGALSCKISRLLFRNCWYLTRRMRLQTFHPS